MRIEDRFVLAFEEKETSSHTWLSTLQQEAIQQFARQGFPTRKTEAWKYTNINTVLPSTWAPNPTGTGIKLENFFNLTSHNIVAVNNDYCASLSNTGTLPRGVLITGFARAATTHPALLRTYLAHIAPASRCPFVALNTAFVNDGILIYVPRNTTVEKPIHLIHQITTEQNGLLQPRVLVIAEENARLTLLHTTVNTTGNQTLTNAVTEVAVGAHANVQRVEIQAEPEQSSLITSLDVTQERNSIFSNNTFTFGGRMIRNNINILADAEHCETYLNGLFLTSGTTHVDNHTLVDHAKPNCYSSEYYKGILDDKSTGVFNGKVLVRQDAQQINAYQSNKSIVLTDTARMYSKPELEIYADDVKCSHGATTGQLDPDAIFYLRARGLTPQQARVLLLVSFARDVVERVPVESLHDTLDLLITQQLTT